MTETDATKGTAIADSFDGEILEALAADYLYLFGIVSLESGFCEGSIGLLFYNMAMGLAEAELEHLGMVC